MDKNNLRLSGILVMVVIIGLVLGVMAVRKQRKELSYPENQPGWELNKHLSEGWKVVETRTQLTQPGALKDLPVQQPKVTIVVLERTNWDMLFH